MNFPRMIPGMPLGNGASMKMMVGPVLILLVLSMMVLPLPTFLLDMLFTFNISVALIVLMVSMFTKRPLDFAAFPTILLYTTLLRLSLNVASTRVVLLEGHNGPAAAGKVIESFGHFLVGGNFAVGVVVFCILVIINFMVITKGAGRIAEVGARFMLDSMPGKQMAIDADLNAGLIGDEEAKTRRKQVGQEAEFYGSMDGASKFVRGDAMAGIVIMLVTMVGGLLIGMLQHGLSFSQANETYVMLTVGDGLVAQIPALVISIAAGVIVSRVNTDEDVGEQMVGQMFNSPKVMFLVAGVIGMLGVIPGMPNTVFLLFASVIAFLGWRMMKSQDSALLGEMDNIPSSDATMETPEATWNDVRLTDILSIKVGYRLIPLVDSRQDAMWLKRIKSMRMKFAREIGFLPSVIHITDDESLEQNEYVVYLKGVEIGRGEVFVDKFLAIESGGVSGKLEGTPAIDPAFGLPAVWVTPDQRELAQMYGYTVVDASTVATTHLNYLMERNASQLLGRDEVKNLLSLMGESHKSLIDEIIPKNLTMIGLQRILQQLLDEDVSIRDMNTIMEVLAEYATSGQVDWPDMVPLVRLGLRRSITQYWFGNEPELNVIGLDPRLEQVIMQAATSESAFEPSLAENIMLETERAINNQNINGLEPVLVVSQPLRGLLSQFLRKRFHDLGVLSINEIPDDRKIRISSVIGGEV